LLRETTKGIQILLISPEFSFAAVYSIKLDTVFILCWYTFQHQDTTQFILQGNWFRVSYASSVWQICKQKLRGKITKKTKARSDKERRRTVTTSTL